MHVTENSVAGAVRTEWSGEMHLPEGDLIRDLKYESALSKNRGEKHASHRE